MSNQPQQPQTLPAYVKVGQAFLKQYYAAFDTNRQNCAQFYGNNSLLTFQTDKSQGRSNILKKLQNLKFSKIQHNPVNIDVQPDPRTVNTKQVGIFIVVSGTLRIMEEKMIYPYVDWFHLIPTSGSNYYILNHVFQLSPQG